MTADWENFTAFGGSLTSAMVTHTLAEVEGGRNLEADIMKFFRWLRAVHDDPVAHAIPETQSHTVKHLIETFFPLADDPANRLPPIRISDEEFPVNSSRRRAVPTSVTYGPQDRQYNIADAPSALGFIFSIAKPAEGQTMSVGEYYLPMLVLYAQCLFLAFICDVPGSQVLDNVPMMVCAMYADGRSPAYAFGSTWSNTNICEGDSETLNNQRKIMMDVWRRENAVDGSPAWSPLSLLPLLDPHSMKQMISILFSFFRGNFPGYVDEPHPSSVIMGFEELIGGFKIAYIAAWRAQQPKPPPPTTAFTPSVAPASLLDNQRTRDALRPLLINLINLRFAPRYNPRTPGPSFDAAFKALLTYFLTPHIYPSPVNKLPPINPLLPVTEVPSPAVDPVALAVTAVWKDPNTVQRARQCLDLLYAAYQDGDLRLTRPFGRCAESYPSTNMRPYFHGDAAPSPAKVSGLALEPRILGQMTRMFQGGKAFNEKNLKETGSLRRPCDVCEVLFGHMGMDSSYYSHDFP